MKSLVNITDVNYIFDKLFPILRSITGAGYKESLNILCEYVPFNNIIFNSGDKVLNWIVPEEWWINKAYIQDSNGDIIVDIKNNNLHVVNYNDWTPQHLRLNYSLFNDDIVDHFLDGDIDSPDPDLIKFI